MDFYEYRGRKVGELRQTVRQGLSRFTSSKLERSDGNHSSHAQRDLSIQTI